MKIYIDQQIHDVTSKWHSYAYLGTGSHKYHPCYYSDKGGLNDSAYVTADDSLWTIDTPEHPVSILALIIPSMLELKIPPLDLRHTTISFSLRGDDLQLHGATCYFWAVTFLPASTRWHYISQPLTIPKGEWSKLQSLTLRPEENLWHCSFRLSEHAASLDDTLCFCASFGFSFVGFSKKVTGKFSLSEFTIHKNLNTSLTYFANFHNFRGWLTLSRSQGCQISAPIDIEGRVVMLGDENYIVLTAAEGVTYVYLTFIKRTDLARHLQLCNSTLYFMLGWKEMAPAPPIDYKQGNMYFFLENIATNTIWIFRQPISQEITMGKLPLRDDERYWFRLTGSASLGSVILGENDKFGYDYLGFMLLGVNATPTGHWTLAEFSIS